MADSPEFDRDHALGFCGNVIVVLWFGSTTAASILRLTGILRRRRALSSGPLGLFQVVTPSAERPSKEARDALESLLGLGSHFISCSALVVPGVGFRIAWIRAFITGLAMVARPQFPHVVFATTSEAAAWQTRLLSSASAPSAKQLLESIAMLERSHKDRYPTQRV